MNTSGSTAMISAAARNAKRRVRGRPDTRRGAARAQTFSSRLSEISPVGRNASISSSSAKTTMSIRPGSRILRREALDQADQQAGEDRALDIAEAADDHDREGLHDHGRAGERRQHQHRRRASRRPCRRAPKQITKVSMISWFGLMPISPAVSRSCATARSALPRNVNFMNA